MLKEPLWSSGNIIGWQVIVICNYKLLKNISFKKNSYFKISIIFSFLSWLTITEILSSINFFNKSLPFL